MSQKCWTIAFAPAGEGTYQVTVRRSGSVHRFEARLPPDISDLWLDDPGEAENTRTFRREPSELSPEEQFFLAGNLPTLKSIGERITDALFSASGGSEGIKVLGALEDRLADSTGIELQLDLSQTPELSGIPWEAAYLKSKDRFLAIATTSNMVRRLDAQSDLPPPVAKPIRILVAAANPHKDLNTDVELGNIEKRIAQLIERGADQYDIKTLPAATREAFRNVLAEWQPHIIHYIGHSAFRDGMGYLYFESGEGKEGSDKVSAETLRNMLINDRPWLVVLNSCESGATSREAPMGGVAQNLLGRLNIPFVVGMQQPVSDDAAICFSQAFYGALTEDHTIADAVSIGRNAISTQADERTQVELITPALYTSGETDRIAFMEGAAVAAAAAVADSAEGGAKETGLFAWMKATTDKMNTATKFFAALAALLTPAYFLLDEEYRPNWENIRVWIGLDKAEEEPASGTNGSSTDDTEKTDDGSSDPPAPGTDQQEQVNGTTSNQVDTLVSPSTTGGVSSGRPSPGQGISLTGQRTVLADGTILINGPGDRLIRIAPDGTTTTTWTDPRNNAPNIEIRHPDGRVERRALLSASRETPLPEIRVRRLADGRTIETYPDGRTIERRPNGLTIETLPDGTVTRFVANTSTVAPRIVGGQGYSSGPAFLPPPLPDRGEINPEAGPHEYGQFSQMTFEGLEVLYCAGERARVSFARGTARSETLEPDLFALIPWSAICDPVRIDVFGLATYRELERDPRLAEKRAEAVAGKMTYFHRALNGQAVIESRGFPIPYADFGADGRSTAELASVELTPREIRFDPERMIRIEFEHGKTSLDAATIARLRPFATRLKDGSFPYYHITSTLDPDQPPVYIGEQSDPNAAAGVVPEPVNPYEVAEERARGVGKAIGYLTEWRNAPGFARTLPNLDRIPRECAVLGNCPPSGGAVHTPEAPEDCGDGAACQVATYEAGGYEYTQSEVYQYDPSPGTVFVELRGTTFAEIEANADKGYMESFDARFGISPHMVSQELVETHPPEQGAEAGLVPEGDK